MCSVRIRDLVLLVITVLAVIPEFVSAQDSSGRQLLVGTRHVPPFAMKDAEGKWTGISIDLWREIAKELNLDFAMQEKDLSGLIDGLESGGLDAVVAALTITSEREEILDFTHPFYHSGLGIAVPTQATGGWKAVVRQLFSMRLAGAIAALAAVLFLVGLIVWTLERKKNAEQFGGKTADGLGAAFWWAAVTMTTVGYGDKTPRTFGGRLVSLVWMFASLLLISSFTAAITSALTVSQLETGIDGPEDLPGLRVATVAGSTAETYLRKNRVTAIVFDRPQDAVQAMGEGVADATVYDAPILRYLVNKELRLPLHVVARVFEPQDYAFGLPQGSNLRESINCLLLQKTSSPEWHDLVYQYLGE